MPDDAPGPTGADPGPPGDDVRRLFAAAQEWAQRTMPAPPSGHPGPECQWCPLCQFASILRGEHPELTERVAEAGTALVGAFRSLLDAAASHTPTPGSDEPAEPRPQPHPRLQRIHLDDAPDPRDVE